MRRRLIGCCFISGALTSCSPPTRLFEQEPFPLITFLACTFEAVHSGVLNPTYFRDRSSDRPLTLAIRGLNADARTATVGGNNGSSTVEYRVGTEQMQFIETTPIGNVTLTTIFAPPETGKPMPAVHSRHVAVSPANVSISQYAGECVAG